jgi:hypothetical protein
MPYLISRKLAVKGASAENQQVLGWIIDSRCLTISCLSTSDKYEELLWINDIQRVQKACCASTKLLATIEGRLNHTSSILPRAQHFLTRLRRIKIDMMAANRPYAKLSCDAMSDLHLWERLLTITHHGVSLNLLTIRQPDIIR